jgi:hypothetical protein
VDNVLSLAVVPAVGAPLTGGVAEVLTAYS